MSVQQICKHWGFCSSHRSISSRESMPPHKAIRPLTEDNQWAERIDPFFLSRTIFSIPFWKSRQVREHLVSSQDRPPLRPLQQTFYMEELHWRHAATSFTHRRYSLEVSHTSYLLQWQTLPINSRTNILTGDTKKNLSSPWLVYFC